MLLRVYHAALWANGAWTVRRNKAPMEILFPVQQQVEDEDDE
jgi:hypothetical protein